MTREGKQKRKSGGAPPSAAVAAAELSDAADEAVQDVPRQRTKPRKGSNPWSSSQGWRAVDVGDEMILGADEDGFAGLEVLDDVSLIDPALLETLNAAAKQEQQQQEPASKKGKKQQQQQQQKGANNKSTAAGAAESGKKRKHTAAAAAADGDDVAALKAKLQQLEAENKALKRQRKQTGSTAAAAAADSDAPAADTDAGAAAVVAAGSTADDKRQQRKQAKKQQRLEKLRQRRELAKQQKRQQQQQQREQEQQQHADAEPDTDMSAWERFDLHPDLVKALARVGFSAPTPIQDAVLEPAIRDRRDVIGAAQTGSGKTLAFGLPILQVLLQEREQQQLAEQLQQELQDPETAAAAAAAAADGSSSQQQKQQQAKGSSPLRALILTPTRELALQVCDHLQALGKQVGIRVIALVGGIATIKQERLLRGCPPVVVATPGRLWDLLTHGSTHLSQLDHLSFFVLDEADRMVQQGHYQELSSILELLPTAERFAAIAAAAEAEGAAAAEAAETAAAVEERERQQQLARQKGIQRKQQRQQQQQQQQQESDGGDALEGEQSGDGDESSGHNDESSPSDDEDMEGEEGSESDYDAAAADNKQQQQQQQRKYGKQQRQQKGGEERRAAVRVQHHLLQTFVFSATLTLPAQMHKRLRRGGGGSSGAASLDSLMDRICFRPRPAIVDLSPSSRLAARVAEGVVTTLEGERDAVLYYLLARHPGRALVFVNAVSAVRRVSALLQLLGLPAAALHAQQQQRQRLKALDRFKASPHGVLVATDVAARGLDVPGVQMVIHYQLPASADTYIHRSGRTARTGGGDGVALALVTPGDAARWSALRKALEGQPAPPAFPLDDRLLLSAKQRVALAAKIDSVQRQDRKQHAEATWARSNADALGIELSDDSNGEGLADLRHSAVRASAAAAAVGGKRGKKRKQDVLAAAAGAAGFDADSQAGQAGVAGARKLAQGLAALQRQLAGMLAVPLQPSISTKYFTGGVSRAAAVSMGAAAEALQEPPAAAAADGTEAAAAAADGAGSGEFKPHSVLPVQAIAETIQLASRLKDSKTGHITAAGGSGSTLAPGRQKGRKAQGGSTAAVTAAGGARDDGSSARRKTAAAAAAAAARGGVLLPLKKQGKKKGGKQLLQQQLGGIGKPSGLARLLMSKNEVKRLKKQQGMFVVRPGATAFGRDVQGASALDVLTAAAK